MHNTYVLNHHHLINNKIERLIEMNGNLMKKKSNFKLSIPQIYTSLMNETLFKTFLN